MFGSSRVPKGIQPIMFQMSPLILNLMTRFGEAKNIIIILTCIKIMPIHFEFNSLDLSNIKT